MNKLYYDFIGREYLMKMRYSSMFVKLITSYVVIISILTVLIGSVSYVFFSKSYNEELLKLNSITHNQLREKIVREVFTDIVNIYIDIIGTNKNDDIHCLFKQNLIGNHCRIIRVRSIFENTIYAKKSHIKAISSYFKNNDIVVSSYSGLTMVQRNALEQTMIHGCGELLTTESKNYTILLEPFDPYLDASISFIGIYPLGNTNENSLGFIAIDINSDLINDILKEYSSETTSFYIVDKEGNIVFGGNNNCLNINLIPDYIYQNEFLDIGSATELYEDTKILYTHTYLPDLKCTLIGVTPKNYFYTRTFRIRNIILIICLCAILIGMFFSGYFSNRIYKPLYLVLSNFKKNISLRSIDTHNEYKYIDHVFNTLSFKVTELEGLFIQNRDLIKFGFVFELLNGTIDDLSTFKEKVEMLDMNLTQDTFCVIKFGLSNINQYVERIKDRELIIYKIIEDIGILHNENIIMHAIKTSDKCITAICNFDKDCQICLKDSVNKLINTFQKKYFARIFACISDFTKDPLMLGDNYNEVQQIFPYSFLMPDIAILTKVDIVALTEKREFPVNLIDGFIELLKSRDIPGLKKNVREIIAECKTGLYSYESCTHYLFSMMYELTNYMRNIDLYAKQDRTKELHEAFMLNDNIDAVGKWFVDVIYDELSKIRSSVKVSDLMQAIVSYIDKHVTEDISLFAVSEEFEISSAYLSRLFKAEVGMNYTEYITKKRLEKSIELLTYTEHSVDSIASIIGFNSSAYFIKKFREEYSLTPMAFKRSKHL